MAVLSKFGFGGVGFQVKNGTIMPGSNKRWLGGERFVKPALFEDDVNDYVYEFGEIVEIVGDTRTNYIVKPIDATTTADAKLGLIMRELTGAQDIRTGVVTNGIPNVTLNIWVLDVNLGGVGAAYKGLAEDVEIGGAVFVGNGTAGTVAGAVYAKAVSNGTIATDLVFKSLAKAPTTTTALAVEIGN